MTPFICPLTLRQQFAKYLVIVISALFAMAAQASDATRMPAKGRLQWERLPIAFEPNLGQAPAAYRFLARQNAMTAGFGSHTIDFSLAGQNPVRLSLVLEGAQRKSSLTPDQPLGATVNYLRGTDVQLWRRNVPTFARLRYHNLYRGIDLVFYGDGRQMEHDFVIAPGADPDDIAMRVTGAPNLRVSPNGDLVLFSSKAERLEFRRPIVYQETAHGRVQIDASYRVSGSWVRFALGAYDRTLPLVVDPVLDYSTYLADYHSIVAAVATDAQGSTYITGLTFDTAYPVTAGAFQTTCSSCTTQADVFVTKLNADGTGQVYSTFLGGSGYDQPYGLQVDGNGNAVLAGSTGSTNFPHNESVDPALNSPQATYGFVTSLTADGSALNYSRILGTATTSGGSAGAAVYALALDAGGNAYVTGTTIDANFPVTAGALDALIPSYGRDPVFATKLQPDGTIAYSAILGDAGPQNGGAGPIGPAAIAVDSAGSAYIYGKAGTLWPVTAGAFQSTVPGTMPYAAPFASKLAPDASHLVYSTYVGDGYKTSGIVVDATGQAILTGAYPNPGYPFTSDALYPTSALTSGGAGESSWLTILNSTGTGLVYSSNLTPGDATSYSLALDGAGNIWVAGGTRDPNFPLVHPLQQTLGAPLAYQSQSTGFVAEFDGTGKNLLFSTYLGSQTSGSTVNSLAVDVNGVVHLAGSTQDDLYTTPGAFRATVAPPPQFVTPIWPFAATIDPNGDSPSMCFGNSPNALVNFGIVDVGSTSSKTVIVRNCGTLSLSITSIAASDPVITVPDAQNQCKSPVAPDATCTFVVQFTPTAAVITSAQLSISSNASFPVTQLPVFGTGAQPQIQVSPTQQQFDPLLVGQTSASKLLMVRNLGLAALQLDLAHTTITGDFSFTTTGCNTSLYGGQICAFYVVFGPTVSGARTGTLTIASNDPAHPTVVVALSGSAVDTYPVPTIGSLDQPAFPVGTDPFTISVYGTNFFPTSQVYVNGVAQITTYGSATYVNATIAPSLRTALGEVSVTVVNPAPGGGASQPFTATLYERLAIPAVSLVSVPSRSLLYASIGASATANANTVLPIDPASGNSQTPIAVGNNPTRIVASDDGHYLYVALLGDQAIQRINLSTGTIDRTFPYPPNQVGTSTPMYVSDMHTVPGHPDWLVVSVGGMLALYNDSGFVNAVPSAYPGITQLSSFTFPDAGTIYALPFTYLNPYFNIFTVDASGVHTTALSSSATNPGKTGAQVISDGTLLYTSAGQVWDPSTKSQTGSFPVTTFNATSYPNLFSMALDTAANQLFVIGMQTYSNTSALVISAYDKQTLQLTGTAAFTSITDPLVHDLSRWGSNGFAFIAGYNPPQVYLLRSSIAAMAAPRPVPTAGLSAASLTFANQDTGTTSNTQTVSFANTGTATLAISGITISGPFTQSSTCGSTLAAGASCAFTLTFAPTSTGAATGTLTITDNAAGSPHTVSLSGTGTAPTMTLATAAGGSTSATVNSGQTANYNLSVVGTPGFTGTVTFSCSGAPANASCAVNPASTTVAKGATATFTVTVTTQTTTVAKLEPRQGSGRRGALALLAIFAMPLIAFGGRRRATLSLLVLICFSLGLGTGCGGGGSTAPTPAPTSHAATTPSGTYTLTASANAGSVTASQKLTLTVQ